MAENKELPSDNELRKKLREVLKAADMSTATEKSLRKQLEEHFQCNLKPKKQVFKKEIEAFLAQCDDMLSEGDEPEPAAQEDGKPAKAKRKGAHTKQSLSEELRAFLGVDSKADVSRGDVVKRIWEYIKVRTSPCAAPVVPAADAHALTGVLCAQQSHRHFNHRRAMPYM